MITFKGTLKDIVITLKNKAIITLETENKETIEGELTPLLGVNNGLKISIGKWRETRSLNANAYFHLLVNKIAEKLKIGNDECKIMMNLEYGTIATDKNGNKVVVKLPSDVEIKQFYDYAKWIGEKEEKGLKLSYYVFYKQTHTLDSKEMARLIDGVVQEAKELGIETLDDLEVQSLIKKWEKDNETKIK